MAASRSDAEDEGGVTASKTTDPHTPDVALETDLLAVINRHIAGRDLRPEIAAETLAVMASACLRHLTWLPPHARAARDSLHDAIGHIRSGA